MTAKQLLSYAYGSKMAESMDEFGLNKAERDPQQVTLGFMKGLSGSLIENAAAEAAINVRLESGEPLENEEDAKKIAYYMGVAYLGGFAKVVEVPATDFEAQWVERGYRDVYDGQELAVATVLRDSVYTQYIAPKEVLYAKKMASEEMAISEEETAIKGEGQQPVDLTLFNSMTDKQKLSYAYGSKMGEAVERFGLSLEERNPEQFAAGFMQGLKGDSLENAVAQIALQERLGSEEPTGNLAPEKLAYYMGLSAISPLAQEVPVPVSDFDEKWFARGFKEVVQGKTLVMETSTRDAIFQEYIEPKGQAYQDKMQAKSEQEAQVNIAAGKAFLANNKTKPGIVTTASGLQYEIIKEGTGVQPGAMDRVKTHYHGTLIDGTVFDSSKERGTPATFGVNQVIQGWQEGIPLMKEGAIYRLYIPQELAYGMQAPSPKIPAGSTLIFDVELIKVNPED